MAVLGTLLIVVFLAIATSAGRGIGSKIVFVVAAGLLFLGFTAAIALCGAVAAGIAADGYQPLGALLFAALFVLFAGPSWRQTFRESLAD